MILELTWFVISYPCGYDALNVHNYFFLPIYVNILFNKM